MKKIKSFEQFSRVNEQLFKNAYSQFLDLLGIDAGNPEKIKDPKLSVVKGEVKFSDSGDKGKNIQTLIESMKKHGITNPYTQIAILGVIGKESNYIPKGEKGYSNTANQRIRKIFGKRVQNLSDQELDQIKKDDVKFFDLVYGPGDITGKAQKYGNSATGEGWKYRGRGFNGITFKNTYQKMQKLLDEKGGLERPVNIVTNPEALDDPKVAAEVAVLFFLSRAASPEMARKFGTPDINGFRDQRTANMAMTNANAGWGKDIVGSEHLEHTEKYAANFRVDSTGSASLA